MSHIPYQGGASIDENGHAYGGQAGDQKDEVRRRPWYVNKEKGWYIYRAIDPRIGPLVAYAMERSVANRNIGYNQWKRYTLYDQVKPLGYDPGLATKPCDCDCSTDIFDCLCYAFNQIGIKFDELVILRGRTKTEEDFRTGNMGARLMATGMFVKFTDAKHCSRGDGAYLRKGDIAVTRRSGHTIALLEDGELAYADELTPVTTVKNPYTEPSDKEIVKIGFRIKTKVKWVQWYLKRLGYDLGPAGVDGDFGPLTDAAVRAFQTKMKIKSDGEVGKDTRGKLKETK